MEFDEFKLRKQVLLEWFHSPANQIECKSDFISKGKEKMVQVGRRGWGRVEVATHLMM